MSVSETQARVKARIWQAVAHSGVNVAAISPTDMDRLVSAITESVLAEMDALLGEVGGQAPAARSAPAPDEPDEQLLWEGRPFLSLGVHYQVTSERVRVVEGIFGKEREDIELVRIQDIDQTQRLTERMLDIGDIHIRSHDPSSPALVLRNIPNVQEVHEILRRAVLSAREKHRLSYREEM